MPGSDCPVGGHLFVELPQSRSVNWASDSRIGRGVSTLSDKKATRKIAQKDPSFRGMLCFNRGDRTFLIRKGCPLRVVRLRREFGRADKMGDLQCRGFASIGFLL
jgi:hypothetical protein